jgi:alkylation response protein AidB-like acyl-CoA dehydrogenase
MMDTRADRVSIAARDRAAGIDTAGPSPLDRAKAISGLVSEEALAGERLGRLTDKAAAALLDANLFSIRLPCAEGGLGGTGVELFEATEEIARADGSAGWCMLISNSVGTFVCTGAGPRARREIFGNGPVACWATLLPKAKSFAVEDGFRVSGNFAWARAARSPAGCSSPSRSPTATGSNGFAPISCPRRRSRSRKGRGM